MNTNYMLPAAAAPDTPVDEAALQTEQIEPIHFWKPPPPPDPPVEARGLLAQVYSNGSETMLQLRDQGWVHIPGAVSVDKVAEFITKFDADIAAGGFTGRFSDPSTINGPETLPYHFWGLDPTYLPFTCTAMKVRDTMRTVFETEANLEPKSCLSSFDAVMATHRGYQTQPPFNPAKPRLPIKTKKGKPAGPGHVDQYAANTATADSHQMFLALTPAGDKDMSTVLLVPCGRWTLQGMMDAARAKFPREFDPTKKNGGDDGMFFSAVVQEWLISAGIAKAIKPKMAPGDILIWSSAMPHCGGAAKPPPGVERNPRLGLIAGFCPSEMVSEEAKEKRRSIIGKKRATGQIVHRPGAHMAWPQAFRWMKAEKWPQVYKDRKQFREDVTNGKRARAYEDVDGDSEKERETKRLMRSLLG